MFCKARNGGKAVNVKRERQGQNQPAVQLQGVPASSWKLNATQTFVLTANLCEYYVLITKPYYFIDTDALVAHAAMFNYNWAKQK
jgi:hypothetical protein